MARPAPFKKFRCTVDHAYLDAPSYKDQFPNGGPHRGEIYEGYFIRNGAGCQYIYLKDKPIKNITEGWGYTMFDEVFESITPANEAF
jgi:hypothetical protein